MLLNPRKSASIRGPIFPPRILADERRFVMSSYSLNHESQESLVDRPQNKDSHSNKNLKRIWLSVPITFRTSAFLTTTVVFLRLAVVKRDVL